VFPHVEAEQRFHSLAQGVASVGFLHDVQLALLVDGEPRPSRAEEGGGGLGHLVTEVLEVAEVAVDGFRQLSLGHVAFGLRGELKEVEGVVEHLSGVVEEGAVGGYGHDFFHRLALEGGTLYECVEVVHIRLQMLAVVVVDGCLTDGGCKGILGIGERGHFVSHKK